MGKKEQVLLSLFHHCKQNNDFYFDNTLVKKYCEEHSFSNPFDVTKLDTTKELPDKIKNEDYFIVHLGEGRHRFVKGVSNGYHQFEEITEKKDWSYRRSLLNEHDTSESNILSVGFNQKVINDFIYGDFTASPKIYNSKRTKRSFEYKIGKETIETNNLQIEIDMTTELNNKVTVYEGKNGFSFDFSVYQIYLPCLYYHILNKEKEIGIKEISACYLLREKEDEGSTIRLYQYKFNDIKSINSIELIKSTQYALVFR